MTFLGHWQYLKRARGQTIAHTWGSEDKISGDAEQGFQFISVGIVNNQFGCRYVGFYNDEVRNFIAISLMNFGYFQMINSLILLITYIKYIQMNQTMLNMNWYLIIGCQILNP